ncbi:MAG: SPFH domain-containing protein [bacterium]
MNGKRKNCRVWLIGLMFLSFLCTGCIPHSTGPTEVGIRVRKIGFFAKKGIEERIYAPGATYFFLPLINDWFTFDKSLQKIVMVADVSKGDRRAKDDLIFRTKGGNELSLDLIIQYKIDPQKVVYILQNVATSNEALRDMILRTIGRSRPRDMFGELTTEEFYVAKIKEGKAEEVKDILNEELKEYGIIVERVSTGTFQFLDANYRQAIEDKKIAEVERERWIKARAAQEEKNKEWLQDAQAEVNQIQEEWEGKLKEAKLDADAYYRAKLNIAEAIKKEGENESKAVIEMNKALASKGGLVKLQINLWETLRDKKIIFLPQGDKGGIDLKTTDINELLQLYGTVSVAQDKDSNIKKEKP